MLQSAGSSNVAPSILEHGFSSHVDAVAARFGPLDIPRLRAEGLFFFERSTLPP